MQDDTSIFLHVTHLKKEVASGDSNISILKDVTLSVKTGETVAIIGASGSGKTTLLTLLAGLDVPTSGDIYFQNKHLNVMNEEQRAILRGHHIGFIFQSFELLENLTALENVMLPLEIQSVPHAIAYQKAQHWLKELGLEERANHYPMKLSGGEQQRVAIARAFVNHPDIIFADEMTGNLDTKTGTAICDIIFSLNQQHRTTLVMVTHDAALAARCERRLQLKDGCLQSC